MPETQSHSLCFIVTTNVYICVNCHLFCSFFLFFSAFLFHFNSFLLILALVLLFSLCIFLPILKERKATPFCYKFPLGPPKRFANRFLLFFLLPIFISLFAKLRHILSLTMAGAKKEEQKLTLS